MTEESIRAAIVEQLTEAESAQDAGHRYHLLGIVKGLLWALTGFSPTASTTRATNRILNAAQVPYQWDGETILIPNEWLVEHGLEPGS
jgi:hypothetical protein